MSVYRHASMGARQRQRRTTRLTRHSIFSMKRPITFQVRKSLVEHVDIELADMETSVFYQRIFILAKNARLTPEESEIDSFQAADPILVDQPVGAKPSSMLEFKEDLVISHDDSGDISESSDGTNKGSLLGEEEAEALQAPTELPEPSVEPDKEVLTHTFRFSEFDHGDDECIGEDEDMEAGRQSVMGKPKDFFDIFSARLQELHTACREEAITPDPMCGLYVHMDEYSILMLESSEDMIGCFTRALANVCETFWLTNRVFQTEDHIKELYTKELLFRRMPAVYLNEKFPTSTPTDEYLMGKQHLIIKDKLRTVCRLIWESDQQVDFDGGSARDSLDDEVVSKSKTSLVSEQLPVDIYRRHMPEIQRIELVLASTRFYHELNDFANVYGQMPFTRDEEGLFWPISNNYTPPNIFQRTPYDINLTFADYASAANQRRTMSLVSEHLGEEAAPVEEDQTATKEETPPKTD